MLKIAVFCGGTGSVALQRGFASIYGIDHIQMDVIVNAYDNGKSTGACRRVFNNRILGPSDVRKNQLLQYEIRYRNELRDKTSRKARLYQLFHVRLSASAPMEYYKIAQKELCSCQDALDADIYDYLNELLNFFFFECGKAGERKLRSTVVGESFVDFALSNIFYASCAAKCGNSLGAAAVRMASILGLKDTVHLISDKSLLLKAETQSGHIIEDEGDIVTWDNPNDRIVRALLMDGDTYYTPAVDEGSSCAGHSTSLILKEANIIIFSSGTQWSSLIPTYMHRGFRELLKNSSAKKYLIMNNAEDHDALGVDGVELCGILEHYLDMKDLMVVVNECAADSMAHVPSQYKCIREKLSLPGTKTHIPETLAKVIMTDYYRAALKCERQFFDLDGTLWDGKGTAAEKKVGAINLALFDGVIVSGNAVEHVRDVLEKYAPEGKDIEVFADYGNTHFNMKDATAPTYLTDRYFLPEDLPKMIVGMVPFKDKSVKVRGGVVLTIKPLENRERVTAELNHILKGYDSRLIARVAGKTSVDIMCADYTKAAMMELIFERCGAAAEKAVFIGNELKCGSEEEIMKLGITTLQVDDVYECYAYLRTRELAGR